MRRGFHTARPPAWCFATSLTSSCCCAGMIFPIPPTGGGSPSGEGWGPARSRIKVFEETGYLLDEGALVGPVLRRHATFDFHAITCRQDEDFFFARIWGHPSFSSRGFTAVEKQVLDEWRWWNLDDLEAEVQGGTVVYPLNFVTLARSWLKGWDGNCPEITEGTVGQR